MSRRREDVRQLRVRDERAHREPAAQRLRAGEEIGLHVIALPGEPRARAAHARLHLVDDHQEVLLVAERADALHELVRRRRDAAFALHRLEHDRDRLVVHRGLDGSQIVVVGIGEADRQGIVSLLAPRLRRRRDRRERAAMEALAHRHDLVAPPVRRAPLACELDRRLVRLRARVAEERLATKARDLHELRGEQRRRRVHVEVRAVEHCRRLVLNRLDDLLVAIADVVDADAAREVVVGHAVHVTDRHALAGRQHHRRTVRRHHLGLVKL